MFTSPDVSTHCLNLISVGAMLFMMTTCSRPCNCVVAAVSIVVTVIAIIAVMIFLYQPGSKYALS